MAIYVLENHPLMSQAITFLLRRIDPTKNIVEVHTFSKLQELMLINGQPKAFIIEPLMMGINGTSGIEQIKKNYPTTPLIIFSSLPSDEAEKSCTQAGADLYIEKTTVLKDLFLLIRDQLGWLGELEVGRTNTPLSEIEGPIKLSKRQKQLLLLIDAGLSNEDIAKKLEISAHTVKVHLWRFYKKLGLNSRTQLIKFSRDNGYL
jgi:DNA-binding NarL/FixJ family response regulator